MAATLGALVAGCRSAPTALDVTVEFGDHGWQLTRLDVTLLVGMPDRVLKQQDIVSPSRPIASGDDFVVLLPDSLDGQPIDVEVRAGDGVHELGAGSGGAIVRRGITEDITIDLGRDTDGGVDAPPRPDLAASDLGRCTFGTTCDNGVLRTCDRDGGLVVTTCGFGCDGEGRACVRPNTCPPPPSADISAAGIYRDSTAGFQDNSAGLCGGQGGPDAVVRFSVTGDWQNVTIDTTGSSFDPIIYFRTQCAGTDSELPLAGPCMGADKTTQLSACSADVPASLVLCGLPPDDYYLWVDSSGASGPYQLNVSLDPVTLNSCDQAGALVMNRGYDTTTNGHADNFKSDGLGDCAGDDGQGSPDAVFYFRVNTPFKQLTISTSTSVPHSIYVREDSCSSPDLACGLYPMGNGTLTLSDLLPGIYFVIIDGAGGKSGPFTIKLSNEAM